MSSQPSTEAAQAEHERLSTLASQIKRGTVDALLWRKRDDIASVLLGAVWAFQLDDQGQEWDMHVSVPVQYLEMFSATSDVTEIVYDLVRQISRGHTFDRRGFAYNLHTIFNGQLLPLDEAWEEVVKAQIAQGQATNQGLVTEAAFRRNGRDPVMYGELKFGSKTEVRIAQEFESRKVLFFPLAVAVKAETGVNHKDHREVDFLVVNDGVVGILEVAGPNHNGRQVSDIEKDVWFNSAGIICLKAYPAELCWSDPGEVVDTFLRLMALHKR